MRTTESDYSEKDLLEKIYSILTGKEESPVGMKLACTRLLFSNKELMDLLQVGDKYVKKLRDNGYIGYTRMGDKYWYTLDDVKKFLHQYHYEPFATNPNLPERKGGDLW